MNLNTFFLSAALTAFVADAATAQTVTIRGKVEDVSGTQNQFYLDGTDIPVVSNVLNLNAWQGQQAFLDVVDIGTAAAPMLRIDAAVATTKMMDMGNLRLGQNKTWEVFAANGAFAFVFFDWTVNTGFLPIPGFVGAWMLGLNPAFLDGGVVTQGRFQTSFTMPNLPALLGTRVSSQALVANNGALEFSNLDQKEIEN